MSVPADFVVVANRLPIVGETSAEGRTTWARSPGGLVSALEPLLRHDSAVWVGWSGRCAPDHPSARVSGAEPDPLPEGIGSCPLVEVELTRAEVQGYYEGFSTRTLWPLYHDAVATPVYHRHHWDSYVAVNLRFAEKVAEIAAPGATVWVHDHQLQLVPAMLRQRRPDLRIGFFLHIPFPPSELFLQMPWRREVVEGLLGSDLVGFHTPGGAANFLAVTQRLLGIDTDLDGVDVVDPGPFGDKRRVTVRPFPISIATAEYEAIARTAEVQDQAAGIRERLGSPKHLLLGVDRLDYTKGIDVRLKAFTELLADGSIEPGEAVFVQIASPSRQNVEDYQHLRDEIELLVGRALGDQGTLGVPPIQYLHQPFDREDLVSFYAAADIMLVTPYRDGMNLVAKEYVAARIHDDGALVLSEFTGAAIEMEGAFLVNPHDADGVKQAIRDAMNAAPDDLRWRMSRMRTHIEEFDVDRWATTFLSTLAHPELSC